MLNRNIVLLAMCALGPTLQAADENSSGLSATYKNAQELMDALAKSAATHPDQAASPISNQDHYRINIVQRVSRGVAMAHSTGPAKGTEVHYIIDGAATVVTGGTIVRPAGAATKGAGSSVIEGGVSHRVTKGDVIVIPAGTPHWYKEVETLVTYLEVRFDVPLGK
jgi:mannose-6-phosphate isomerase-like protein (cupin superfamily)